MTTALLATPPATDGTTASRPAQQPTEPRHPAGTGTPTTGKPTTGEPTAGTRAAGKRAAGKRAAGLAFRWTVRLVITLAVLAFGVLAVGPHVLDYRTMTMLTGSMSPVIDPGDVTIVTPLPVDQVTAGMIITYHVPIDDHHLITHRVTSVDHGTDGSVTVQTKGDANDAIDPWQATLQGDTAYQVRAVLPAVGHLISALRTPIISQALVYGAPALLAGWLLLSIWRPTTDQPHDPR
jgi:signal peptidase